MCLRNVETALLIGLIVSGTPLTAKTITFRENAVVQDGTTISTTYQTGVTSIRKSLPDNSLEGAPTIVPGTTTGSAGIIRAVLSYDLSLIPADMIVTNATLTLFSSGDGTSISAPVTLELRKLNRLFVEKTVTWNKYDGVNAWTTTGGDYDAAALASVTANPRSVGALTFSGTALTQLVADTVQSSGTLSLILKLTNTEELYNGRYIFQIVSDDPTANQPTLTVGYKLPPLATTIIIH